MKQMRPFNKMLTMTNGFVYTSICTISCLSSLPLSLSSSTVSSTRPSFVTSLTHTHTSQRRRTISHKMLRFWCQWCRSVEMVACSKCGTTQNVIKCPLNVQYYFSGSSLMITPWCCRHSANSFSTFCLSVHRPSSHFVQPLTARSQAIKATDKQKTHHWKSETRRKTWRNCRTSRIVCEWLGA